VTNSRVLAVIVAAVMVAAGIGGTLYALSLRASTPTSQGLWADGPTLYQAVEQVNSTVRNITGGPWELFSYIGFAPEGLFSPGAYGYVNSTNLTLKYCQSQFNGLTVWNGTSFPVFNGSIASGTATFWQFAFFSGTTHEIIVATDVLGIPHVYAPLPVSNPCLSVTGMASGATYYESWVNPLPVDTSVQAAAAYDVVGRAFEGAHSSLAEIYANGWAALSDATNHGPGGGVEYSLCGLVEEAGMQAKSVVGEWANGTVQNTFNGSLSCTAVAEPGPPVVYGSYLVALSSPGSVEGTWNGLRALSFPLRVEFPYSNGTIADFDGWGLTSWMTDVSLANSTGHDLVATALSCQTWVPTVTDCQPTGSGWAALLLSPDGGWMDSFPSGSNASAWAIPNVPIIGGEQLVVVCPTSWNVTGDLLTVRGATSIPSVSGSAAL
jgi:hypothetical protein